MYYSGAQIFPQKSVGHFKILGARRVTQRKFHTENPQILDATIQNSVAKVTYRPEIEHPWNIHCTVYFVILLYPMRTSLQLVTKYF